MDQDFTGKIYSCRIDGTCYRSRETAMVHLKMQHNIVKLGSFYIAKRDVWAPAKEKLGRDDERPSKR